MQLKQRKREPVYIDIMDVFVQLEKQQEKYNSMIENCPIYPNEKLFKERNRIELSWQNRDPTTATCTKEIELAELNKAFEHMQNKLLLSVVIMRSLFGRLYGYVDEMINDNDIGYLSDEDFKTYLERFDSLIMQDQRLKLNCCQQPQSKTVLNLIAQNNNYNGK